MAEERTLSNVPMSENYDQASTVQLESNQHNLLLLTEALTASDPQRDVLHLADFGSATGLNSMKTFSQAFTRFRETSDTQISVHHVDIPNNNWSTLFNNAVTSPYSYLSIKGTFVEAVGRSNYVRVFPDNFLSIVYSTYALHWLSRPLNTPNQMQRTLTTPSEILHELSLIAEEDLDQFLLHRRSELKVGGRMILHTPSSPFNFTPMWTALTSMITDGLISPNIIDNVRIGWYARSESDFRKSVAKLSPWLQVIYVKEYDDLPPFYKLYVEDHNKEAYVQRTVQTTRAASENLTRKMMQLEDGPQPLLDELYKRFGDVVGNDIRPIPYKQLHVVVEKTS